MSRITEPLVADLVAWIAREPRTYAEVMDAWRTSCPRLTVWEEASERGLVERRRDPARGAIVVATAAGRALIELAGRASEQGAPAPARAPAARVASGATDAEHHASTM